MKSDIKPFLFLFSIVFLVSFSAPMLVKANQPSNGDFSITNMNAGNRLFAQYQWYVGSSLHIDPSGYADITYCEFRLKGGSNTYAIFRYTEDTNTFSIQSGAGSWDLDVSGSSAERSGVTITITWKFKPQWDASTSAHDIEIYVVDLGSLSDTDSQTGYYDVVTDLITTFSFDDSRGNIQQTIMASGLVSYSVGSSWIPPDSEFTSVSVHNPSHVSQGTDTSVVSGAWSVSFSASSSVSSTAYHLYIDMADADYTDGDEATTASFISDRIRVDSLSATDGRIDVGTLGEWYATASLEYDGHALGSGDSLSLGGYTFTWDSGQSRWEATDTKSSVQAVTVNSFTSGNEATYGVTAGNVNGKSATIVWDRLEFVSVAADDSRINVGVTFELRYQIRYDYDDATFDSSKGSISGFAWDSGNSWWDKTVTGSSSVASTNYDETYVSITDSTYGLTVKQDVSGVNVVTDRLQVQSYSVSDSRADINANVNIDVTVWFDYDNTACTTGTLTINGYSATHQGSGVYRITRTSATVASVTYNTVACSSESTYGITTIDQNSQSSAVVWDRFEFVSVATDDSRISISGTFELRYQIRYDYDDVVFTSSKGSITGFVWDSGNSWWDKTVTGSSSVTSTNYDETYISITDSTYGLAAKQDVAGVNVITDKARIYYEVLDDSRVNVGSNIEFRVKGVLLYDNHAFGSGDTVTANFGSLSWDAGNFWFDGVKAQGSVGDYVFQVSSLSESSYGITSFEVNVTNPTGIWDRVHCTAASASDNRVNVNDNVNVDFTLKYDYDEALLTDGTVTIEGFSASYQGSGVWRITKTSASVTSVTYNEFTTAGNAYGITSVDQNGKSASVIWDRILVTITPNATNPMTGATVQFVVSGKYQYDNGDVTTLSFQITRNGTNYATATPFTDMQSSIVTYLYTASSASESTYGLSAFSTNTVTVNWQLLLIEAWQILVDDSRVNVGENVYLRYALRFNSNQSAVSSGTLWINGTSHAISAGWANFTVAHSSVAEMLYAETAVNVNGVTEYAQVPSDPTVIWDKIIVGFSVDDSSPDMGTQVNFTVTLTYSYDGLSVVGYIYNVERSGSAFENPHTTLTFDDVHNEVVAYVYDFTGVSETQYGLTAYVDPSNIQVSWGGMLKIYQGGIVDGRINFNVEGCVWFKIKWANETEYTSAHGTAALNGSLPLAYVASRTRWEYIFTLNNVGARTYHVAAVSGGAFGDEVGDKSIVWDRIGLIALSASETRVPVNTEITVWATANLNYDSHMLGNGDNLTINGYQFLWDGQVEKFYYKLNKATPQTLTLNTLTNVSSSEVTYGINTGTSNGLTLTIEWYSSDGGGGGDGDGGTIFPDLPDYVPKISDENLKWLGVAFIVGSVVFAICYGQYKDGQKTWKPKKTKEVKWKRKGKPLE